MYALLIATMMGCSLIGSFGKGTVVIPSERSSKWENAKCNDGTPFAMTMSKAKKKSEVWVVKVGGGYFCDDKTEKCSDRKKMLTTGSGKKDGDKSAMVQMGLHSRDPSINPEFHDANHVVMQYCSSDFWLGEKTKRQPTTGSSKGWFFSGRKNFDAGFGTLVEEMGMTDGKAKVLVVGHSAGGMGVVSNVPLIKKHLKKSIGKGNVKMIVDGIWVPRQSTLKGSPVWNKWGDLHKTCTKKAEKKGKDALSCFFGEEWYPLVEKVGIPILVQQSSLDPVARKVYGVKSSKDKEAWQALCKTSFAGVDWLFTGGRSYHTATFDSEFTQGDKGKTLPEVVTRFWKGKKSERVFYGYN